MYGYEQLVDVIALESFQMRVEHWLLTKVLVWSTLAQITFAVAGFGIAYLLARPLTTWLQRYRSRRAMTERAMRLFVTAAMSLAFPAIALAILWAVSIVTAAAGWSIILLTTCVNLLVVWIVIRLTSVLIQHETWSRLIALAAFVVATLNILDLLGPTILFLDEIGVRLGNTFVSVLDVLKGAIELAVLLWLALTISRLIQHRLQRARTLTPSLKVLTGKLVYFSLISAAFIIALVSVGIDLTAFAVFTGAVGVGIGFGLQKPISNLISGIILLLDQSIKPGDVVELGDTFGWVSSLNARYASITTRDGTEWLIPNEDLITQRVINWSFNNERLRLATPIGISYESDVRRAMELVVEAAKDNPRVLKDPQPVCRLMGFGDNAVNLELRIWIADPANGVVNVRSEILLGIWDSFHQHGIHIPFPQRDLHIKGDSQLNVTLNGRSRAGSMAA